MNNCHLAGMPSGASGDLEKPTTAHRILGMQNISATSSSVCTKCNIYCGTLITTLQSSPLDVRNGNTLKTDSTWKVLQLQKLRKLRLVQKSDNTPPGNRRLTTGIQNPHTTKCIPSPRMANRLPPSSSLQAQATGILVLLRTPHREATMVPPLDSRTPVKATIKGIHLVDREPWTSWQASLGK